MSEIFRRVPKSRKARPGDYLMVAQGLDRIVSVAIYPPVDRTDESRPPLCPIRDDWWAVVIHTDNGGTEWTGDPDMPGPR